MTMTARHTQVRTLLLSCVAVMTLHGCGGNSGGGAGGQLSTPVDNSFLFISAPDFYFGTRDVGTRATQNIQIANRGADIYPLKSVTVIQTDSEGNESSAEEFFTEIVDDIELKPAEVITVGISFQPITEGPKTASFVVDFDTIQLVERSVNINEQNYYAAKDLERSEHYPEATQLYNNYIDGNPVTINKRRAAIKLPVLQESEVYGTGEDLAVYLSAMDLRETGQLDEAKTELDVLGSLYSTGYLADDALYLKGYIQLIDEKNYKEALRTMQLLRKTFPDSTYYDTALYSEALAEQGIGNNAVAREILLDLRFRHTGIDVLGVAMPKDNLVSRLWFDRANDELERMKSV